MVLYIVLQPLSAGDGGCLLESVHDTQAGAEKAVQAYQADCPGGHFVIAVRPLNVAMRTPDTQEWDWYQEEPCT